MVGPASGAGGERDQQSQWIARGKQHGDIAQTEPGGAQTQYKDLAHLLGHYSGGDLRDADGNA